MITTVLPYQPGGERRCGTEYANICSQVRATTGKRNLREPLFRFLALLSNSLLAHVPRGQPHVVASALDSVDPLLHPLLRWILGPCEHICVCGVCRHTYQLGCSSDRGKQVNKCWLLHIVSHVGHVSRLCSIPKYSGMYLLHPAPSNFGGWEVKSWRRWQR